MQVDPQTKHYSLGVGMLPLARTVLENSDFPNLVQPQLDDLSRRYGVTAIGVELPDLRHMIVVALARSQAPVRLHVDVGSRFPALISATGRCVAAFSDHPLKRDREALSLCAGTTRRATRPGARKSTGAPPGLQHRPRQLHRRRHHRRRAGAERAGTISHTLAAVGLGSQLDRATALALARDMRPRRKRWPRSSSPQLTPQASALAASVAQDSNRRQRKR